MSNLIKTIMRLNKGDHVIFWVMAIVFNLAASWSYFSAGKFPLPGLVQLASQEKYYSFSQAIAVTGIAIFFSIKRWHSRDNLLVLQGITLCLWLEGFLYIGVPFGLAAWVAFRYCQRATKDTSASNIL